MILFNKKLKKLLSNENLLQMTRHNIDIMENSDDDVILNANGQLWDFIGDLAEACGYPLPEYEP